MKIETTDIRELLPVWMQEEGQTIEGLADGTNWATKLIGNDAKLLTKWNQIDKMTSAELDALAYELNIPWYISSASLEAKRNVIKSSDLVHSKLGTVYAAEQVINDYFDTGEVREWNQYNGQPYHFKVRSTNAGKVWENYQTFLYLLQYVKRKSAWLDNITIGLDSYEQQYAGIADKDFNTEDYFIFPDSMHTYVAFINHDHSKETVEIGVDWMTIYVNSDDATATAADILEGQTAYIKNEKVAGTLATVSDDSAEISSASDSIAIKQGYHDGTGSVKFADIVKPTLTPENIRVGTEILGVPGEYTGLSYTAESADVKPKNGGTTVTPSKGYDYLKSVTIEPIPYNEVPNEKGTTVIIGDEISATTGSTEEETNG